MTIERISDLEQLAPLVTPGSIETGLHAKAAIHAHGRAYLCGKGRCGWRHEHEDVVLTCERPALPGTPWCLWHAALAYEAGGLTVNGVKVPRRRVRT